MKSAKNAHTIVSAETGEQAFLLSAVSAALLKAGVAPRQGKYGVKIRGLKRYSGETYKLAVTPVPPERLQVQIDLPGSSNEPGSTLSFELTVPPRCQTIAAFERIMAAVNQVDLHGIVQKARAQEAEAREAALPRQKRDIKRELEKLAQAFEQCAKQAKANAVELRTQLAEAKANAKLAEVQAAEVRQLITQQK